MAYKVAKKFIHYAVVKDEDWGKFYLVDIEQSVTLKASYSAKSLKWMAEALEGGTLDLDHPIFNKHNTDFMAPIDMPDSLKKMQANLKKGIVASPSGKAAKPIGSTAPSIEKVIDKGAYQILEMSDGTYGMFVKATGEYKLNLVSAQGAGLSGSSAAKKHAASILSAQGIDAGQNATETLSKLYEARVREAYGQAAREMSAKLAKYMENFAAEDALMVEQYEAGFFDYGYLKEWRAKKAAIIANKQQMIDVLANDLAKADAQAMAMLNGYMGPCYMENFTFATFQIEKATGISTSFQLYDKQTVEELLKNPQKALLPPNPNIDADIEWSKQKISSAITQSVLQGESVPAAAARLQQVVGMSANSAVRAARTALTGAENYGRLQAGYRAKKMGLEVKKQWLATVDDRTRQRHRDIDRETVEEEEPFSNGCMYPGDWSGEPAEVYNCRCTMRHVRPGHEYDDLPEYSKEGKAYEEWKNEKKYEEQAKVEKLQEEMQQLEAEKWDLLSMMPENKVYQGIWKNDVTLSEYEAKIDSIPKKLEYYKQAIAANKSPLSVSIAQKHIEELAEFEKLGKEYAQAQAAVAGQIATIEEKQKAIAEKIGKATGSTVYSDERKAAAFKWANKREADDHLRHITEEVWRNASRREQLAIWGYTEGSGKYNRPLSGFDGSWEPRYYKGVGKVSLNNEGAEQAIKDMTNFVSRSVIEDDMWVRRGCGASCMDSFFGLDFGQFERMTSSELQQFVGQSNRIAGFVSCGTASEIMTGFSGEVSMRIFIPKGTNAVYAEPFSRYSGAAYNGKTWDGIRKQTTFGTEFETIIQRGASYTCTACERRNGRLFVELEVHPEAGYDLFTT